jgi:hypothetical protein
MPLLMSFIIVVSFVSGSYDLSCSSIQHSHGIQTFSPPSPFLPSGLYRHAFGSGVKEVGGFGLGLVGKAYNAATGKKLFPAAPEDVKQHVAGTIIIVVLFVCGNPPPPLPPDYIVTLLAAA